MTDAILQPTYSPLAVAVQPMRLGWPRRLHTAIIGTDLFVVIAAVALAQVIRFGADPFPTVPSPSHPAILVLGASVAVVWMVALSATRSRDLRLVAIGLTEYSRVITATLWTFGGLAIFAFLAQVDIARGYLAVALPVGLAGLLVTRFTWRRRVVTLRRQGRCMTGTIVAGPRRDVSRVIAQLAAKPKAGYKPIAVALTDESGEQDPVIAALPQVSMDELVATSKRTRTRAVMIAGSLPGGNEQIRTLGWDLENSSAELILVSRLTDVAGPRMQLRPVEGLPMVHVDLPQYSGVAHVMKRAMDIVVASAAIAVLSPLLAVLAVAVRVTSAGPILFKQERVGLGGTRFEMLKFRSMVVDAEQLLGEVSQLDEGNGVLFKIKDDPRVTRLGRTMRRYSLDELPQLFNVLAGDMSVVGPRPPLPCEVEKYEDRVGRRLLIKPGLTGPWQVGGRSSLSWEDSVRLDLSYVENWSITGDLLILLKTVRAVLRREGAY